MTRLERKKKFSQPIVNLFSSFLRLLDCNKVLRRRLMKKERRKEEEEAAAAAEPVTTATPKRGQRQPKATTTTTTTTGNYDENPTFLLEYFVFNQKSQLFNHLKALTMQVKNVQHHQRMFRKKQKQLPKVNNRKIRHLKNLQRKNHVPMLLKKHLKQLAITYENYVHVNNSCKS